MRELESLPLAIDELSQLRQLGRLRRADSLRRFLARFHRADDTSRNPPSPGERKGPLQVGTP